MSNKIIDEQRRARNEFIKLKQMQKGEISAESKSEEIVPITFKEKIQNYWYHFKWHTIVSVLMSAFLIVSVSQCVNKEKIDMIVVMFAYSMVTDSQTAQAEEYIEQYATDVDDDGNVNVRVVNCTFNYKSNNKQYAMSILQKVQTMIATEPKAILYIVDEKAEKYINTITENGVFESETKLLNEEFYSKCGGTEEYETLPEDLRIAYRKISGTTMEKNELAKKVHSAAKEVYKKIPTKKTVAN